MQSASSTSSFPSKELERQQRKEKPKEKKQTKSKYIWKNLMAGGFAGGVEAALMYPTEYVKTQLQLQANQAKSLSSTPSSSAVSPSATPSLSATKPTITTTRPFTGVWDCFITIVRERGPLSLYRGVSTLIFGSIFKTGVRFATFSQLRNVLQDEKGQLTPMRTVLAGLGAGTAEALIAVTPTETVKTRLIADQNSANPKYRGLIQGVSLMIKEYGIKGVYAGVVPTVLKQSCNQGCRFTVYEGLKKLIISRSGKEESEAFTPAHALALGMFAGGFSVYVTMPFDVIKTRMQSLDAATKYKSTFDCMAKCFREEGLFAFWKGTTPRLFRVMCSGGITFTAYEIIIGMILKAFPDPVPSSSNNLSQLR